MFTPVSVPEWGTTAVARAGLRRGVHARQVEGGSTGLDEDVTAVLDRVEHTHGLDEQ